MRWREGSDVVMVEVVMAVAVMVMLEEVIVVVIMDAMVKIVG